LPSAPLLPLRRRSLWRFFGRSFRPVLDIIFRTAAADLLFFFCHYQVSTCLPRGELYVFRCRSCPLMGWRLWRGAASSSIVLSCPSPSSRHVHAVFSSHFLPPRRVISGRRTSVLPVLFFRETRFLRTPIVFYAPSVLFLCSLPYIRSSHLFFPLNFPIVCLDYIDCNPSLFCCCSSLHLLDSLRFSFLVHRPTQGLLRSQRFVSLPGNRLPCALSTAALLRHKYSPAFLPSILGGRHASFACFLRPRGLSEFIFSPPTPPPPLASAPTFPPAIGSTHTSFDFPPSPPLALPAGVQPFLNLFTSLTPTSVSLRGLL